jgi:hypothetical protein
MADDRSRYLEKSSRSRQQALINVRLTWVNGYLRDVPCSTDKYAAFWPGDWALVRARALNT